jgi:anaerobic magnesium-protoporphyrin IX monomethyl ester cyclase
MQILLISPPMLDLVDGRLCAIGVDAIRECPPVGLYALAAALEAQGHGVTIGDLVYEGTRSIESLVPALDAADLVGIGATSMAWPTAVDVIGQIRRRRPEVPIVCGGIHPTLFDRHILTSFPVQFVVRGEGEMAVTALCEAIEGRLPLEAVPNLSWTNSAGDFIRNQSAQVITPGELADFPVPDYSRLPAGGYRCLGLESSRGCAFDCSFCSTPYRHRWRGLSASAVVDRIEQVLAHQDKVTTRALHIVDDEFSMQPERATEIARLISRRGLSPKLLYDSRAQDLLHEEFLESIAEYTSCLLVGAECGYDEGLKRVGKGSTCATLELAAKALSKHGMAARVDFSFILGLPWEDEAEVMKTLQFATHLHVSYGVHVMLQWYRQIPGSRLWDDARKAELVHEAMYDDYGFFRDVYLFRTSCRLSPSAIYRVSDVADQLRCLSDFASADRPSIVHHFPWPIALHFPRPVLEQTDGGLENLRDLSRARRGRELGIERMS